VLDLASERAGESQEGGTCLGCAGNFITFILAEMNLHINLGLTNKRRVLFLASEFLLYNKYL
ncbi:MAG: hypothetical protein LKI94_05545, partial [Sporolactobacillus sp.]|nr:hypothetical protein [Sporolactobacillus sp.]